MKILVKSQVNFEKSQENLSKKSGKLKQKVRKSPEKFLSLTCGNPVDVIKKNTFCSYFYESLL